MMPNPCYKPCALPILFLLKTRIILGLTKFSSQVDPSKYWICRDPTQAESGKDENYQLQLNGGCMPDATCVNGKSNWTNLFG